MRLGVFQAVGLERVDAGRLDLEVRAFRQQVADLFQKTAVGRGVVRLAGAPQQVASFGEDPDGELLVAGFDGKKGRVWRIAPGAKQDGGD